MEFVVSEKRLATAKKILAEKSRELEINTIYNVMDECRWSEQIGMNGSADKLDLTLTDLQTVMLAAAFAAISESRGEMKESSEAEVLPF